jgi:hypothetical protein
MRKPFDMLAEGLDLSENRGDRHSFEPLATMVEQYVDAFASATPPYLRQLAEIASRSA